MIGWLLWCVGELVERERYPLQHCEEAQSGCIKGVTFAELCIFFFFWVVLSVVECLCWYYVTN